MVNNKINKLVTPDVSKMGGEKKTKVEIQSDDLTKINEFKNLLKEKVIHEKKKIEDKQGINLSAHAAKRLKERNIKMDSTEYVKLRDAINTLRNKGGQDSLVITNKAAYIVDVNNNRVVTAIDKDNIADNVFTKIDSTLLVE